MAERVAPDPILAPINQGAVVVHKLTTTIPIVFVLAYNPILVGLAQSLARPGGNATGLMFSTGPELLSKRLSLLREAIPASQRIGFLYDPSGDIKGIALAEVEQAAKAMGMALEVIEIGSPDTFDAAFSALERMRPDAVMVFPTPQTFTHRREIVRRMNASRLAAMYPVPAFATAGGLMSYAPDYVDQFRRSADYMDRILRGANPGDLPIQQPTRFELIVNLKTAKAIGITLPTSLMLRADRVIE